jgi:hypothetical protein
MINATQFANSIEKEFKLIIGLSKNITPAMMDYKPKEGMRSMQELLHYLPGCGYYFQSYWMTDGSQTVQEYFTEIRATRTQVTLENFESEMNIHLEKFKTLISSINEQDWQSKMVKYPWGAEAPIGEAMLETSLKWLTAYKYQLFMYIKMNSDAEIGTKDVWVGV